MDNAPEDKIAVEANPPDKALGDLASVDKYAIRRYAKEQRRKRAHRRKLRRYHTKG